MKRFFLVFITIFMVSCFNVSNPLVVEMGESKAFSLVGQIKSFDGSGLFNISVSIKGAASMTVKSNGAGYYRFDNLQAGLYSFEVENETYLFYPEKGSFSLELSEDINQVNFVGIPKERVYWGKPFTTPATYSASEPVPVFNGKQTLISDIQGDGHSSRFKDREVENIVGIVTFARKGNFEIYTEWQELYIQSLYDDNNRDTSEGIRVLTSFGGSGEIYNVGDLVLIRKASVRESKLDEIYGNSYGHYDNNLSVTELEAPQNDYDENGGAHPVLGIIKLATDMPLPSPVALTQITSDKGYVPSSFFKKSFSVFNRNINSVDFFESIEGMRVSISSALVVGVSQEDNSIKVIPESGKYSNSKSFREGLLAGDLIYHPDVITVARKLLPIPIVNIGDVFLDDIVGIVDYSYGEYKVFVTEITNNIRRGAREEITELSAVGDNLVTAFINCDDLSPKSSLVGNSAKVNKLIEEIAFNLKGPDIVALSGLLDDSGVVDDNTRDSNVFINEEILQGLNSIVNPKKDYKAMYIRPENNRDGLDGYNPRIVFLYNSKRVSVDRRPTLDDLSSYPNLFDELSVTNVIVNSDGEIENNPSRLGVGEACFEKEEKPLVGEFKFRGEKVVVVACSFSDLSTDTPLRGAIQPPERPSIAIRAEQKKVVSHFVENILSENPNEKIIVMGGFNEVDDDNLFYEENLFNLMNNIEKEDAYTYSKDGSLLKCDSIYISSELKKLPVKFDIVHTNSEFAKDIVFSNYDPVVASFSFSSVGGSGEIPTWANGFPTASTTKCYSVSTSVNSYLASRVYYVALEGDVLAISGDSIRRGVNEFGQPLDVYGFDYLENGVEKSVEIDGLLPNKEYTVFMVLETESSVLSDISRFVVTTRALADRPNATDLFISEYLEGGGDRDFYNRVIEIANFTGADVNLTGYHLVRDIDGNGDFDVSDEGSETSANSHKARRVNLSGVIKDGEVFLVVAEGYRKYITEPYLESIANMSPYSTKKIKGDPVEFYFGFGYFNGDEQILLQKENGGSFDTVDWLGVSGESWGVNVDFVRNPSVKSGRIDAQNPRINGEWKVFSGNTFSNLGFHRYDP